MEVLPVHIAVLTIADDAATADRATARAIGEAALAAGHEIVDEELAKDNESAIRDQLVRWIAEENIDVVIVAAGVESEAASAALAPLVHQTLPGFTDLFRWLTFQEIGASAMLSAAEAAQCQSTFVFVLPAHEGAVRAAMDKLILPQLDVRTKPKNLVTQMPRLKVQAKAMFDAAKSQPVASAATLQPPAPVASTAAVEPPAPAVVPEPPVVPAAPLDAVPTPIAAEKTAGGSGVAPKLPARSKSRTANTISRKLDDPPTKPIDIARLEKQIALSTQNDAQTKQVDLKAHDAKTKVVDMSAHQAQTRVVDSGRMLPRVPPGADEAALEALDEEALTFRAPSTPRAKPPTGQIPSVTGRATPPAGHAPATSSTSPAERTLTTPSFSTPIARTTPVAPYRAVTPPMTSRSTVATPPATPIVTARPPLTPRANATPPASPREEVLTPETPVIALRQPARSSAPPPPPAKPPTTPPPIKSPTTPPPIKSPTTPPPIAEDEAPTQRADREAEAQAAEAPTRPTPQPNAAELWARSIAAAPPAPPVAAPAPASAAVEEAEPALLEPDEEEPASAAATDDEPSPISTLFANQPPRTRTPTAPPAHLDTLARTIPQGSLPEGEFSYPSIKRSGPGLLLKLLIAAAVVAAGFFAFVKLYPTDDKPTQTAAVTPPQSNEPPTPPPAPVAEVLADAQEAAPTPPPEPAPEIEIEPPAVDPKPMPKPVSGSTKPAARPPADAKPPAEVKPSKPAKPPTEVAEKPRAKPDDPDAKPEPANPDCDEVSCVMTKYDRPCCERFKPSDGFTPRNVIPDNLDKPMVKAGVETVKPRVVACGEKNGAKGTVRVAVTVAPEGNVKSVSVTESPDTALGECVAAAMRKARFGKSANGGEFNYPFVF